MGKANKQNKVPNKWIWINVLGETRSTMKWNCRRRLLNVSIWINIDLLMHSTVHDRLPGATCSVRYWQLVTAAVAMPAVERTEHTHAYLSLRFERDHGLHVLITGWQSCAPVLDQYSDSRRFEIDFVSSQTAISDKQVRAALHGSL